MSQRNQLFLGLGVIATMLLAMETFLLFDFVRGRGNTNFDFDRVAFLSAPFVYWGLFFWARRMTPVRIASSGDGGLELAFRGDEYAEEFAKANPGCDRAWETFEEDDD